jgi:hypothetical protein
MEHRGQPIPHPQGGPEWRGTRANDEVPELPRGLRHSSSMGSGRCRRLPEGDEQADGGPQQDHERNAGSNRENRDAAIDGDTSIDSESVDESRRVAVAEGVS